MSKSQLALVIDIRSDSVGGAIVTSAALGKGEFKRSEIIKSSRQEIELQADFNLERFFADLVKSLKFVLNDLFINQPARPAGALVYLSAPFYAAQTRTIRQTRQSPITITNSLISSLVEADVAAFQQITPPLYREILNDGHELIEHKVMQIKLNRYETHSPFGQQASEIEVSHYLSVSSSRVVNRFREIISQFVPHRPIAFHSFPFALYTIARDVLGANQSLLLDLGAEVTELSLMTKNILWETVSFPYGRNYLIRQLAKELNTTLAEVISSLQIYLRGEGNELLNTKLKEVFGRVGADWVSKFKESFAALTENHLGANNLILIGDELFTPMLSAWLSQPAYQDLLIGQSGFKVSVLDGKSLDEKLGKDRIKNLSDASLMLEIIFYDKLRTTKNL